MFTDDVALLALLAKFNIALTDVQRIPHNFRDDALLSPDLDVMSAYITSQPHFFEQHNRAINIMSPADYGIDLYGDILFTSEEYLKNNPDTARAFRRASLKGWQYALENSEEVIDWIKDRYHSTQSVDSLRHEAKMIKRMIESEAVELGHISPKRLQEIAEIYQQMELVPEQIDLSGFYYTDHITTELPQ